MNNNQRLLRLLRTLAISLYILPVHRYHAVNFIDPYKFLANFVKLCQEWKVTHMMHLVTSPEMVLSCFDHLVSLVDFAGNSSLLRNFPGVDWRRQLDSRSSCC